MVGFGIDLTVKETIMDNNGNKNNGLDRDASAKPAFDLNRDWPGEEHDENGVVTEHRIVKNGMPYMATYDKDGKCTGFGYV
jgi:hypothetical protein